MLCLFRDFKNRSIFIKSSFIKYFSYLYSLFMLVWVLFVTVIFTLLMAISFSLSLLRGFDIFALFSRRLLYLWSDCVLLFYRVELDGIKNLIKDKPFIIFSNHQGNLDIPILTSIFRFRCIWCVKDDLFSIPVFSWVLKKLSYIPVVRGDANFSFSSFRRALRSLSVGDSLVIFPEARWSPNPYKLLPFKGGLYYLALHTGVALLPVTIVGSHHANPPDSLRFFPSKIKVLVHKPVCVDDYVSGGEAFFLRSMAKIIESPLKEDLGQTSQ